MKNSPSQKSITTSKRLPCSAKAKEYVEGIMNRVDATMKGLTTGDVIDLLINTYFGFAIYIEAERRAGNLDSVVAAIKFKNGGSKKIHLVNVCKGNAENPFEDLIQDKNPKTDRDESSRKALKPAEKPETMNGNSSKNRDAKAPLTHAGNEKVGEKIDEKDLFSN